MKHFPKLIGTKVMLGFRVWSLEFRAVDFCVSAIATAKSDALASIPPCDVYDVS